MKLIITTTCLRASTKNVEQKIIFTGQNQWHIKQKNKVQVSSLKISEYSLIIGGMCF